MGWLEVLALLKNTLPHLLDLKPMLERILARGGPNDEAQRTFQQLADTLRTDHAKSSEAAQTTLDAYSTRLLRMEDQLRQMKTATDESNARLDAVAAEVAGLAKTLRLGIILLVVILVVSLGIITALMLHHA